MSAYDDLSAALDDLADAGHRWPCRGRSEWIEEDPAVLAEAAQACAGCCVLSACAAAGAELRPSAGVWAGVVVNPHPRNRAKALRQLQQLTTTATSPQEDR